MSLLPWVLVPPCRQPGLLTRGTCRRDRAWVGMHACCGSLGSCMPWAPIKTPPVMAPRLFWGAKVSPSGAAAVSYMLSHPQGLKAGRGFDPSEQAELAHSDAPVQRSPTRLPAAG